MVVEVMVHGDTVTIRYANGVQYVVEHDAYVHLRSDPGRSWRQTLDRLASEGQAVRYSSDTLPN